MTKPEPMSDADIRRLIPEGHNMLQFARAIEAARDAAWQAHADALVAQDEWRTAIDEALIASCIDCVGRDEPAVNALARLIEWEVKVALDPAVSSAAAALVAQAVAQERERWRLLVDEGAPYGEIAAAIRARTQGGGNG